MKREMEAAEADADADETPEHYTRKAEEAS